MRRVLRRATKLKIEVTPTLHLTLIIIQSCPDMDAQKYSFRYRVNLAPGCGLTSEETLVPIREIRPGLEVAIVGANNGPISKGRQIILRSDGWGSEKEAADAALAFADIFALALVRCQVGVEHYPMGGSGYFTEYGLKLLEAQYGGRVLGDTHGIMVFETDPPPMFAKFGLSPVISKNINTLIKYCNTLIDERPILQQPDRLAIELFNSSFFAHELQVRFVLLVMAIEAMLILQPRSGKAVALVG
jgi:hypothetical protein